jgi:shikimate dehydrogenase
MHCTIDGQTDVYLILGDPVEQVRAPQVFNLIFKTLGINAVLVPARVKAGDILTFVQSAFLAQNVKGMFLAIPHKALVMDLLASCNSYGSVAGAVNGIRRNKQGQLEGGLFDGKGFLMSLDYFGMAYAGKKVLILGAGGGASAIAAALAMAGAGAPTHIALYDPTPEKAHKLATQIAAAVSNSKINLAAANSNNPAGYDLVFNASPLGLAADDAMPCDVSKLASDTAVVDILMKNQPTPFLKAVRARGLQAEPGFEMLIQQAPDYLEFFGYSDAAHTVRQDANFIRDYLYPPEMAGEIQRPARTAVAVAKDNNFVSLV